MDTHIPVLVKKLSELGLHDNFNNPIVEGCDSCGSKLFYVVTTQGIIYNPYTTKALSEKPEWTDYIMERAFTSTKCAQCGTANQTIGTWEHCIIEITDKYDAEDYEEALRFLQTGIVPLTNHFPENMLSKAEEIKKTIALYWTNKNVAEAIKREQEEMKKQTTKTQIIEATK